MSVGKLRFHKFGKIVLCVAGVLLALYVVLGVVGVPLLLTWGLEHKAATVLQRPVRVQRVSFNPFLFRLQMEDVEMVAPDGLQMLAVGHLTMDISFLQLWRKTLHIEQLVCERPYVSVRIAEDGGLNWADLQPQRRATPAATHDKEPVSLPAVLVEDFQIRDASVYLEDHSLRVPFATVLRSLNINVRDLTTGRDDAGTFMVEARTVEGGEVKLQGSAALQPVQATVAIDVAGVGLEFLQPYLQAHTAASLTEARLYLQGKVTYQTGTGASSGLQASGDIRIAPLVVQDALTGDDILDWKSLRLESVEFSLPERLLTINNIVFDMLKARLVRESQGTNIQRMFMPAHDAVSTETPVAGDAAASRPFDVVIKDIRVEGGRLEIVDATVQPRFVSALDALQVSVQNVTTRPGESVAVTVQAHIDDRGRVVLKGEGKPLADPVQITATLQVQNYGLEAVSPYVGTYTGRAVGKGRLDLDMDYQIANNRIQAKHKARLESFAFGQRVESDQALGLPFELALSLLKDVQGNIRLSLPVSGDLSSPDFRYFPLVARTLRNVIFKIVSQPFSFLASLVGGDVGEEELRYVVFAPGEDRLTDKEREKLRVLARALRDRPLLAMDVPGAYDPESDWQAIKADAFEEIYQARRKESSQSDAEVLEQYYQKEFGLWELRAQYQQFVQKGLIEDPARADDPFHRELRHQLVENAPANRESLASLGRRRAERVVAVLHAEDDVFDNRLTIVESRPVVARADGVPLELTLTTSTGGEMPDAAGSETAGDPPQPAAASHAE